MSNFFNIRSNFLRQEIVELSLNTAKSLNQNLDANANYYTYDVTSKLKLICLDYYKFSALGYLETDETYKNAYELLNKHNKNEDKNSYNGLRGHAQRFTKFNGGLGDVQMEWLNEQLKICKDSQMKCIICGHLPIHTQASDPTCISWVRSNIKFKIQIEILFLMIFILLYKDSKAVLELIWSFENTVIG